jgi:hypothetical protein
MFMSKAIDEIKAHEESMNLMRLSDAQAYFVRRYGELLPDEDRYRFERELIHLIHMTYREAQLPLTKQLTDLVLTYNRPFFVEQPK